MKKSMIFVGILAIGYANAQTGKVGINIPTPNATLDVKAKTNNGSKVLELQNSAGTKLVTALDNGNVGINTTVPTQKLDVNGNARVRQMPNGSDEATYSNAVVADANGNLAVVSRTNPTLPNATQTIFANAAQPTDVMLGHTFAQIEENQSTLGNFYFRYTGQSITLPPGKWIVYCGFLLGDANLQYYINASGNVVRHNVWVRGIIDDNPNNGLKSGYAGAAISGSPVLVSANMIPGSFFAQATGLWFVDNTTTSNKTYYLKISFEPRGFRPGDTQKLFHNLSIYGEDYLIAIRRE